METTQGLQPSSLVVFSNRMLFNPDASIEDIIQTAVLHPKTNTVTTIAAYCTEAVTKPIRNAVVRQMSRQTRVPCS
jgi:hypothetical protein